MDLVFWTLAANSSPVGAPGLQCQNAASPVPKTRMQDLNAVIRGNVCQNHMQSAKVLELA